MRISILASAALLTSTLASSLIKRQATTDASYLPSIAGNITTSCFTPCTPFMSALTACVNSGGTTIQLATCACAAPALSATKDCASCVAADPTASAGPAQIMNYNGFAQQCIAVSLASSSVLIPTSSSTSAGAAAATTVAAVAATPVGSAVGAPTSVGGGSASTSAVAAASSTAKSSGNVMRVGAGLGGVVVAVIGLMM